MSNNENNNNNSYYLSQLTKEAFKSKYKFIDFKKPAASSTSTTTTTKTDESDQPSKHEDIQEFYKELVKTNTPLQLNNPITEQSPQIKIKPKFKLKEYSQADYLKAAQNNDLNIVEAFLNTNKLLLNVKDDFKWNALMIAVASFSNRIVEFFFREHSNNPLFNEFVNDKDNAGNNAEAMAIKLNNKTALNIITQNKSQTESNTHSTPNLNEESTNQFKNEFYCEICQKQCNENQVDHLKSMAHLLKEYENEPAKNLNYNYHLRSSNKGYQLLCRSGWNEQSGLGRNEQGNKFPIKAKQKLDRKGIGTTATDDKSSSEKSNSSSRAGTSSKASGSIKIETTFKNLKAIKKQNQKQKNLERNRRFYFNN